jgi:hypothetical protein
LGPPDISHDKKAGAALADEPGRYVLTEFLARTLATPVLRGLGLDRRPDLRDAYFAHYTRVLMLAQHPTPATHAPAERAAASIGLPLRVRGAGGGGLESALEALVG